MARAGELAPDSGGERSELPGRRRSRPQHPGRPPRREVAKAVQRERERRRFHAVQRLLDPALGRGVDLADEGKGDVQRVRIQPTRVPEPGLQLRR